MVSDGIDRASSVVMMYTPPAMHQRRRCSQIRPRWEPRGMGEEAEDGDPPRLRLASETMPSWRRHPSRRLIIIADLARHHGLFMTQAATLQIVTMPVWARPTIRRILTVGNLMQPTGIHETPPAMIMDPIADAVVRVTHEALRFEPGVGRTNAGRRYSAISRSTSLPP